MVELLLYLWVQGYISDKEIKVAFETLKWITEQEKEMIEKAQREQPYETNKPVNIFETLKRLYQEGTGEGEKATADMLKKAIAKLWITAEEYEQIVGSPPDIQFEYKPYSGELINVDYSGKGMTRNLRLEGKTVLIDNKFTSVNQDYKSLLVSTDKNGNRKTKTFGRILRSLPNGVKDIMGVTRRIGELVFTGNETFNNMTNNDTTMCFQLKDNKPNGWDLKNEVQISDGVLESNYFDLYNCYHNSNTREGFCAHSSNALMFRVNKSRLSSHDNNGFKALLTKWNTDGNPLIVHFDKANPDDTSDYGEIETHDFGTTITTETSLIKPNITCDILTIK